MDQPIRPRPSNAHKPRVRLPPPNSGRCPVYNVRVPRFSVTLIENSMFVRLEVMGHWGVDAKPDLKSAMWSAVEHAKFLRCHIGPNA